ncbi:OmpA family protein [Perlucidibaca aquatica]|uniref:OmpA family protein n=1 Tax=Perlucidibaca aquatica TaxID=1852776 RepID=UPI0012FE4E3D|nr:OmpA family protein [Perlucidibaca aquatica]
MKITKIWLLPIVLAGIPVGAAAAQPVSSLYHVYMGALYGSPDSQRALVENGNGFAGAVGIPLSAEGNRWHLELGATTRTFKTPKAISSSFFRHDLTAGLMYSWGNRDELTPYVKAALGLARNDIIPDSEDETGFTGYLGAGLTRGFGEFVRGRVEVGANYDEWQDGYVDGTIQAGIEIPLGRKKVVEIERIVEVQKIVEVEKLVPVAAVDGAAPTIKEVEVIKEVPPPDSDGDRISDAFDKCPSTLTDVRTDNNGCAITQTLVLKNIVFDTNKATIKPESQSLLDASAEFFKQQPDMRSVIAGHTDSVGKDASNLSLSKRRAEAVKAALIQRGVTANRLQAIGLGETLPIASNSTDGGRAENRRVEFLLVASATH